MERGFQTEGPGSNIQRFLNARASIVKDGQQHVIALALDGRAVRLVENSGDLAIFQMTERGLWRPFCGNAQDISALTCRQRFTVGDEAEETAQRGQPAVPRSDRCLSLLLRML